MTDKEQQHLDGTERSQDSRGSAHKNLVLRRQFLKLGAAGGAALVASVYVKPSFRSIGAAPAYAATPVGDVGCTPGFWKNWTALPWPSPYTINQGFLTVFSAASLHDSLSSKSLLEALQQGGGCEMALGRHAVAALLNAASLGASFGLTEANVITLVNAALALVPIDCAAILNTKDQLEGLNEASCPLGGNTVDPLDDWM
jgi:hypothetical protein